jgi:B12-binding domain/radical SAM domain protein
MNVDVILIHPPSIFDFREKVNFPGPIAYTVGNSTEQFMVYPVGLLSIAEYLERHGYKARVDNLCERMLKDDAFNVDEHIKHQHAKIFGIDLHWMVHSQGAVEVARLYKQIHPDSLVVLGGLTASVFYQEIIEKYEFIDAVIRGEGEKPFLQLLQALVAGSSVENVPNIIYRDDAGAVKITPLMEPADINEFEFTRLDLLSPKSSVFSENLPPHYSLPVCRGCIHNCVSCGGSCYSYKKYFNRMKPSFRSPQNLVKDIRKLAKQGIELIFLFQDIRMGGRKYCEELFRVFRESKLPVKQISMELFGPADEEFIKGVSEIGVPVVLNLSPESMVYEVRKAHGRDYTNEQIYDTIRLCKKYKVKLGIFTMLALARDTKDSIRQMWNEWENILKIDRENLKTIPTHYAFGPMILLDPGSLGFDDPQKYGYKLRFKNLEDYIDGMSQPSWHQWISYETESLNHEQIVKQIIDSIEYSINLRARYGLYSKENAEKALACYVIANRLTVRSVDEIMASGNKDEIPEKLKKLEERLEKIIPDATEI